MPKKLSERLQQLEDELARVRKLRETEEEEGAGGAIEKFESFLQAVGVEPAPDESLAMALARALDISYDELCAQIEEEIDPVEKFLMENGTLAEIEQRKAAGTWPSGSEEGCANVSV